MSKRGKDFDNQFPSFSFVFQFLPTDDLTLIFVTCRHKKNSKVVEADTLE